MTHYSPGPDHMLHGSQSGLPAMLQNGGLCIDEIMDQR
jgi:hypothetical protein